MEVIDIVFYIAAIIVFMAGILLRLVESERAGRRHALASNVQLLGILIMVGLWVLLRGFHIGGEIPTINIPPHPLP